jgi:hypothetical protein
VREGNSQGSDRGLASSAKEFVGAYRAGANQDERKSADKLRGQLLRYGVQGPPDASAPPAPWRKDAQADTGAFFTRARFY